MNEWRSNWRGSKPNFFCTSSERSKRMRSASFLNLAPIYFSTCSRLTMVRLTFFLMGKPVSLLAKCRISSTELNSSLASADEILWSFSSIGSTSTRLGEGVDSGCAGGAVCGDCCGVADGEGCGAGCVSCAKPNDMKKNSVASKTIKEDFFILK